MATIDTGNATSIVVIAILYGYAAGIYVRLLSHFLHLTYLNLELSNRRQEFVLAIILFFFVHSIISLISLAQAALGVFLYTICSFCCYLKAQCRQITAKMCLN